MEEKIQADENVGIFDNYDQYVDATTGSRFLNFLIDYLFMHFALSNATAYMVGYLLSLTAPEFLQSLSEEGEYGGRMLLLSFLIVNFNYLMYYTICEKAFKGYTLGKLITGTRAIRNDGNPLTFRDAILRSLSRMVPFEPFSAFGGSPWHDSWTNTRVIKAR